LSLHRIHNESHEVYFCTITCYKWLPLIEEANAYGAVYRWFEHLKKDRCLVVGYVIMPNHFHVLLYPTHSGTSINKMVGECKRFMAYDIVQSLKKQNKHELLTELAAGVQPQEKRKGKLHQVFRLSFDARKCLTEKMVWQKLDYIHKNPVSGKWSLVNDFTKYPHSSAAFYELGAASAHSLVHYKDLGKGIK
jgi:REP element-mobilizing transposase RayT